MKLAAIAMGVSALPFMAYAETIIPIMPPEAFPGGIHRQITDPIAAAAARAAAASRSVGNVIQSTPAAVEEVVTDVTAVVNDMSAAAEVVAEEVVETAVAATTEIIETAEEVVEEVAEVMEEDPDLPFMTPEEIAAYKAPKGGAIEVSPRPRARPLSAEEALAKYFAENPLGPQFTGEFRIAAGSVLGIRDWDNPQASGPFRLTHLDPPEPEIIILPPVDEYYAEAEAVPEIIAPRGPMTPAEQRAFDLINRYGDEGISQDPSKDLERLAALARAEDLARPSSAVRINAEAAAEETEVGILQELMKMRDEQMRQIQQLTAQNQTFAGTYGVPTNAMPANYGMVNYQVPQQVQVPQPVPSPQINQAALEGVPSLDFRGELPAPVTISAQDVPAGSQPFAPAEAAYAANAGMIPQPPMMGQPMPGQPQMMFVDPNMIAAMGQQAAVTYPEGYQTAPVNVGNGENLLTAGWKLGLTGTGHIGMYLEGDPNSVIELSDGMVVGSLGRISDFGHNGSELFAQFEGGQQIRSPLEIVRLNASGDL